jgi:hypothetical protein
MDKVTHAFDATIILNYEEAGMVMTFLDFALCHSESLTEGSKRQLRPLIDKMSSTFGFNTERLDRLLKGQRVRKYPRAF